MTIHYELKDNIAWIYLDDPTSLNAFDKESVGELKNALLQAKNDDPSVLVITGKGKAFSAGGNVKLMKEAIDSENPAKYMESVVPPLGEIVQLIYDLPFITVAAINGACAGAGLGLALHCDFRVAKESAVITPGFIKLAGTPDTGTSYALPRIIGYSKAIDFLLFSPAWKANKALEEGLLHRVFPDEQFEEKLNEFLETLIKLPKYASRQTKLLLRKAFTNTLKEHMELEKNSMITAAKDPDHAEGVNAFVEKRHADFPSTKQNN